MAEYVCWSGGTGADGTKAGGWAAAYTDLDTAITSKVGGDVIYVHTGSTTPHDHDYNTTGTITIAGPSSGDPVIVIGVDKDAGTGFDTYTPATSPCESNDGTGGDITLDGSLEVWGLYFQVEDNMFFTGGDINEDVQFYDCTFKTTNATGGDFVISNNNALYLNCDFLASKRFMIERKNTFIGGTINSSSSDAIQISGGVFIGVDFSANANSSSFQTQSVMYGNTEYIGCMFHASLDFSDGYRTVYNLDGSDVTAGDWFYHQKKCSLEGDCTLIDTIYRDTTGNTYDGTNEYSLMYTQPTADYVNNGNWNNVFIDTTGSTTFTVEIANATGDLTDNQVWLEIEYFKNAGNTLKTILSDRAGATTTYPRGTPVASATNQTDSSETWTGITEYAQKLAVTAAVNQIGMARWRVCGKTTTTFYVCPAISVT